VVCELVQRLEAGLIESFSVAACCLPDHGFSEGIQACIEAEVGGLGVFESKLDGSDADLLYEFLESGLRATLAVPTLWSVFPAPGAPGPTNLDERIELLCASVRRLAMFDPVAIGIHTGPVTGPDGYTALIGGLRRIARAATFLHPSPVNIAIEPVGPGLGKQHWPIVTWDDALRIIEEVDDTNLRVVLDTAHLGDVSAYDIADHLEQVALVQVADLPDPQGGWADRLPPGDGPMDFAAVVRSMYDLGYRGWYELELWPSSPMARADAARVLPRARETIRALHTGLLT
jgi:sugar phosphate isomerase/epimerase